MAENTQEKVPVPATQYMLPHGRSVETTVLLPRDAADAVDALGFKISAEILTTGHVATYCKYGPDDEDEDTSVTENGPAVTEKLADMIRRCAKRAQAEAR